ncbi:exonuclease domain-containing protein [Mycolicibacterium mucogenicum]|uniref:Exonuclease domain-containing protein n=1 Tax=Mycolicibacterium mucogenicum DSM 44124 TaxID=1226753 RepID=A0A8H2JAR9_MYCMU|nr:exonuclease domain-containing protein [Mycolicibacterium mucogenicum]KAB7761205.1 hypothetical protein MMUC44124_01110 [Mycolicibacterium mucogenicum DSM 44124]QPG70026.1 hypothetical protein C1S78_003080 [Mycolicibacterium mucogenicum DSM 44124]
MTDYCFLDTETIGLDPKAPVWEFAGIRARPGFPLETREFTIEHDPGEHLARFRAERPDMASDYDARYHAPTALSPAVAAEEIHYLTNGATIVGCNPGFDIERLTGLLRRNGIEPAWHYHPLDTASMAQGWLAARGELPDPPYKSDQLSRLIGVDPDRFRRHTAMADARWCWAQWVRMTSEPGRPVEQLEPWLGRAGRSE